MTIALGMLASDGIVLAADTEVSWGEYLKTEGTKVALLENEGLAIAGAGDGDYLDAISHELQRAIRALNTDDVARIGRELRSVLERFHRQHVLPWKDPTLEFLLLIGLQKKGRRALWVTRKATMRPCVYATIGVGSADADSILTQLFENVRTPRVTLAMAQFIAAYAVYLVKDRVMGCGKNTDMILVRDGRAHQLSRVDVGRLEYFVSRFLDLQTRVAQFASGYIVTNNPESEAASLANFFLSLRSEYEQTADFRGVSRNWTLGDFPLPRLDISEIDDGEIPPSTPASPRRKRARPRSPRSFSKVAGGGGRR